MIQTEDVSIYLPQYLSADNYQTLLEELKSYPSNIDKRLYSNPSEKNVLFQGDGYDSFPFVNMSHIEYGCKNRYGMILSNTCDIDLSNKRLYPSSIMYAPIISLEKYVLELRNHNTAEAKIERHLSDVRQQRITSIFYLPAIYKVPESIVFLDRVHNIDNSFVNRDTLAQHKLFSLSDYGFYLFLFKLSVHFSRIRERFNRGHL